MQLDRDIPAGLFVRSFRPGSLRIGDQTLTAPVILTAAGIITDWQPPAVEAMSIDDFAAVLARAPDLLLLGTGIRQRFPPATLGVHIMRAGTGFEVMDTGAACRTFNLLAGDGRHVAAALLLR